MELLNSLIEEDKFSEACSFCPIYEEIYIQANEKGLLSKELIQVMQQYGIDVPVTKKETKLPNIPTKAERKKSKKLGIEIRKKIVGDGVKKIVGDGVKKILDMSDDELVRKYDGKSEDEVQEMLYEEPWCENEYFDDDLLAFLCFLMCAKIKSKDYFICFLAHLIVTKVFNIHVNMRPSHMPRLPREARAVSKRSSVGVIILTLMIFLFLGMLFG